MDKCEETIFEILNDIQTSLRKRAWENMQKLIKDASTLDEVRDNENVNRVFWCGSVECANKIEEYTGKKILGIPFNSEKSNGKCIVCGKDTSNACYVGKPY